LEVAHLLTRLEAAGIGPWQIAELKASEAKLAELAKPSGFSPGGKLQPRGGKISW